MTATAAAPRRWWREHGIIAVSLALVVAVNLWFATRLTMLSDEVFSIDTARRSLAGTVRQALDFDLQPPLYFLALNLWLRLADSVLWARLLSLLACLLAVVIADRWGRGLGGEARWLPLLAALSPVLLQAGSYVRGYAVAACLVTAALFLFWRTWLSGGPARPVLVAAFVAACAASILTFYYSGFVIGALLLAGLVVRARSRSLWVACGTLALVLAPWIPIVLGQAARHPDLLPPIEHGGMLHAAGWLIAAAFDGVLAGAPLLDKPLVRAGLVGFAAALLACRLASLRERPWSGEETALAITACLPLVILGIMRYSNAFYVEVRHWTPAAIAPLVFASLLASRCARPVARRVLTAGLILVMAAMAGSRLRNLLNWPDVQAALAFVRATGDDGAPIVVYRGEYAMMLRYYISPTRVIALPREASLERFPLDDQVIRNEGEVAAVVERAVRPGGTFWLVEPVEYDSLGGAHLEAFVRRRTTTLAEKDTALLRVRLLQLAAPAQSLPQSVRPESPIPRD